MTVGGGGINSKSQNIKKRNSTDAYDWGHMYSRHQEDYVCEREHYKVIPNAVDSLRRKKDQHCYMEVSS